VKKNTPPQLKKISRVSGTWGEEEGAGAKKPPEATLGLGEG